MAHLLRVLIVVLSIGCAATTTKAPPSAGIASQTIEGSNSAQIPGRAKGSVEQVPIRSSLMVEGHSMYNLERELQQFVNNRDAMAQNPRQYPLFAFFGTSDAGFVRDQVTDIHQFILPLLAKKVEESPLKFAWNNEYRVSFTVLSLGFDFSYDPNIDWPQGMCGAEIGVTLLHIPDNQIVFTQEPNLIVQAKKSTPGGRQTLNGLYADSAQKIFEALSTYWINDRKSEVKK